MIMIVTACTGTNIRSADTVTSVEQRASAIPTNSEEAKRQYRLGSGDKIKLKVFDQDELSGEFEVDGSGMITVALIGQVSAKGLTQVQMQNRLTKRLKAYLRDPRVTVDVLTYRPFYMQGEVKSGGEYPFVEGLVVKDAIAKAGGYTYRAVTSYVYIRHAEDAKETKYSLNKLVPVRPGDNIRVSERIF